MIKMLALAAIGASLAFPVQANDYPIGAVWRSVQAFCEKPEGESEGWELFDPEPDSVLDFLRYPRLGGSMAGDPPIQIFTTQVEGREIFASQRSVEIVEREQRYRRCMAWDFNQQDELDVDAWEIVTGLSLEEDYCCHRQRLAWQQNVGTFGRIEVRMQGWGPPSDSVRYLGMTLISVGIEDL